MLREKITESLKEAMRSRNEVALGTIRMINAAIKQIKRRCGGDVSRNRQPSYIKAGLDRWSRTWGILRIHGRRQLMVSK